MNGPARSGRALILGLGRFGGGREAARFLARRGHGLRVADRAARDSLQESIDALDGLDVEWCLGREDEALLDDVDLVVVNPAVPAHHPLLAAARARGVQTAQEVELFLRAYPGRVVAVTGTNGKSTTTTLCAAVLRAAGLDVLCGGNIGHSLLADEDRWHAEQIAVLEMSSFQLERLDPDQCAFECAVLTRITRDHLDRHGTLEAYHAAKARAATAARAALFHAEDDPVAAAFSTPAGQRQVWSPTASATAAAFVSDDGWLELRTGTDPGRVAHVDSLELMGPFQRENALAASLVGALFGARREHIGHAVATARPLPHRLQRVGARGGIEFWDNGVSTTIESTVSALDALAPRAVHWIGGGKSKEGPEALPGVADALSGRIASAHLFGAVAPGLGPALGAHGVSQTTHDRLERAFDAARGGAAPGDVVLFSPAFASFDQFPNFRVRATAFLACVTRDDP